MSERRSPEPVECSTPRAVFEELVSGAVRAARPPPTELAVRYLIELLAGRVREVPAGTGDGEPALGEELLRARLESGATRARRLHALGDRALFVSGFFGDSLRRSLVDLGYYREVGRAAYAHLASDLSHQTAVAIWPRLFEELADRFRDFVDVLAEVGDRARPRGATDLLRLFERYIETGSSRDRRRLVALGQLPPDRRRHRVWQ
jgi:hypothetical protein